MKKINILQMLPSLDLGGAQTMIISIYQKINKDKYHFDFVVDHPQYKALYQTVKDLGCQIYEMPAFKGNNYIEVRKSWEDFLNKHQEYQIFHCHARRYASLILPIVKKHHIVTIIHSHNTSDGKGIKAKLKYLLQLPLRWQADYYMACSLKAGQWLFGKKVSQSNRFQVINNAIDTDIFLYNEEIRKKYRQDFEIKDEKIFIQVGRFDEQKNHLFILEVFSQYCKDHPEDKLLLIGDGGLRNILEDKIRTLNLKNNVWLLGERKDVNNLLQMSDIYLMPSLWEGLSVSAIEAQASGITCLFSDKVDHNVAISDLCQFIELNNEKWLKALDQKPVKRINHKQDIIKAGFDIEENIANIERFYSDIVK